MEHLEQLPLSFNAYLGYSSNYVTAAFFTIIAGVVVWILFVYHQQRKLQIIPTEDDEENIKTPGIQSKHINH